MVKQDKTVTPTDGKVTMPASKQALSSQERGRCNMAFPRSHQAELLANPTRCPHLPAQPQPQHSRQEDLPWDHLCVSTAQTPACWAQHHAPSCFWGIRVPSSNAPESLASTRTSRCTGTGLVILVFVWQQRAEGGKSKPLPGIISASPGCSRGCQGRQVLPCAAQRVAPHRFEKSLRKTLQYELGSCPGTSSRSPPRCSLLAAPEAPGPIGVWLHGIGSEGARGQALGWPLGHQGGGAGGRARVPLHPQRCRLVATATLSGLRCSIPRHGAGTGSQGRTTACCLSPHRPWAPAEHPRLPPHSLPTASAAPRLPLPFSRGEGGCPHSSQCCPMSTQRPELGEFSTWRGPQAMEVMNCWEKKASLESLLFTRVVQWGSVTSSNTPAFLGQHPNKGGILKPSWDTQGAPREATDGQGLQKVAQPILGLLGKRLWLLPRAGCYMWARN